MTEIPDPIFAAIERHRIADMKAAATYRFHNERDRPALEQAASLALLDLVAMTPATAEGGVALLRYLDQVTTTEGIGGGLFADYDALRPVASDLLTRIAGALDRQ